VPGVYNVITVEIQGFPSAGLPSIFEVEITAIPTVRCEYIEFIGGSPNIYYGGDNGWSEGGTIEEVAANLAYSLE